MYRDAKSALVTLLCSLVRRIVLGVVITFGESNPLVQFFFVHYSSLLLIALIGILRPLETRGAHRIELSSEFLILALFCNLLCHSGLVSDLDVRYYTGWSIISIVSAGIILSFGNVLRISITAYIHAYRMCKHKNMLKKKQKE